MIFNVINKKLTLFFTYLVCFLLFLKFTLIDNISFFHLLLPISVCFSFVLIILNYKKFNSKWLIDNYILLFYFLIRIISIFLNKGSFLNFKTLVYEIFFLIIVNFLFDKNKKTYKGFSKMIIVLNLVFNVVSIIYQYIVQRDFSRELFGIYTNPNGMAILTIISLMLYINLREKSSLKRFDYFYLLFSTLIIFLSESRTIIIAVIFYIVIKLLLEKKIIELDIIRKFLGFMLIFCLMIIIVFSYINKNNYVPSNLENEINDVTTNRYFLWKYSIFSLERNPIYGIGENNIGEYRYFEIPYMFFKTIDSVSRKERLLLNNNHNGYLQLLVGNGIICFIIFFSFIYKEISKLSEDMFSFVAVLLLINMFENELIVTQSLVIFLLIYFIKVRDS